MKEIDKTLLGIVEGPLYANECSHAKGDYIASFRCVYSIGPQGSHRIVEERLDLYVHDYKGIENSLGQGICLRFGDEGSEYHSAQTFMAITMADHEPYRSAFAILRALGDFKWTPKSTTP